MRLLLGAAALIAGFIAFEAQAQTVNKDTRPVLREGLRNAIASVTGCCARAFTVTFQAPLRVADADQAADAKSQEAARKALYAMVQGECAILSEVFKAECRFTDVVIYGGAGTVSPKVLSAEARFILGEVAAGEKK